MPALAAPAPVFLPGPGPLMPPLQQSRPVTFDEPAVDGRIEFCANDTVETLVTTVSHYRLFRRRR